MATGDVKRKLTAIFSTDVEGYSRLMEEDELATIETLTSHKEIMGELIRQYRGRVLDSIGDNLMAEFASVVDAVQCAVEVQQVLNSKNEDLPENRRMNFRIGINLGDVIEEGERIYGDGVNVAARIEGIAEAGGICISGTAFDQVESKLGLEFGYLGEQTVKNIKKPVRVYRLEMEAGTLDAEMSQPLPLPDKPSIAVLPFVNMSNDPEQEYFSDGITEEIISALAKLEGMKVISRTSVFCFKGKDVDLQTIGNKLRVNNVLEGSVRKAGNRLRITAQLINVANDSHIWSETFDRELKDVFAIQEDISQAIVNKFKIELKDKEKRKLVKSSTDNQQSYDLYLKGMFSWNKGEPQEAIGYFEKSIALDSENAHAYAMLATVYRHISLYSPFPAKASYEKAKTAALKALEIDKMLAEAHVVDGEVKMAYEYDWAGAEKALSQSIELNPGLGMAHFSFSMYHFAVGESDKAIGALERALELDPLSNAINSYMGMGILWKGEYERAIEYLQRANETTPNYPPTIANLGLAYAKKGDYEEAISTLLEGAKLFPENPFLTSALGCAYGLAGKKDEAQQIVDGFIEISKKGYFSPMFISRVYAGMGNVDKSIDWLEKAYEDRDPLLLNIKAVPSHDYMHANPRFIALLKKMGLED
ncbi:MAG: adenylate/guanylate cyclase domain-containing protein [Desulfobacteraceae bacterium]